MYFFIFLFFYHIAHTKEGGDKAKTKQKRQQWVCRRYMSCAGEMQWTPPTKGLGIGVHSKHHGRGGGARGMHYSLCTVESPCTRWYAALGEILASSFFGAPFFGARQHCTVLCYCKNRKVPGCPQLILISPYPFKVTGHGTQALHSVFGIAERRINTSPAPGRRFQ